MEKVLFEIGFPESFGKPAGTPQDALNALLSEIRETEDYEKITKVLTSDGRIAFSRIEYLGNVIIRVKSHIIDATPETNTILALWHNEDTARRKLINELGEVFKRSKSMDEVTEFIENTPVSKKTKALIYKNIPQLKP